MLHGEALGPLHGVPLSIKSSIAVAGMPWETGSPFRRGVRGERDATLVRRARDAGAIILGVTNVAEQLMAWETDNALYGRTNSPWDLARTPGGSSGGESAAIAAGLSAGGVGSDGGGSIRVPAHFTGIVGLKPTPGRVPATGHFPPCGGPFALTGVVGPMARTVDDVALLLSVMAGADIGDPNGHPVPLADDQIRLEAGGWGLEVRWRLARWDGGTARPTGLSLRPDAASAGSKRTAGPRWNRRSETPSDAPQTRCRARGTTSCRSGPTAWTRHASCGGRYSAAPRACCSSRSSRAGKPRSTRTCRSSSTGHGGMPRLTAERLLEVEIARDLLRTRLLRADGGRPGDPLPRQRGHRVPSRRAHVADRRS